ncbi:MAG: lysine--tRNA ligase [Acidobacteria bacterium]|nr:lysine--tRNA ligase [Acidobacteriota bacterium]
MTERMDDFERGRLAKIEALRASGVDPYPVRFERTHDAAAIHAAHAALAPGEETSARVTVAGRIMLHRVHGGVSFGTLRDSSGDIQLFCQRDRLGDGYAAFGDLDLGDWVGAEGEVVRTKKGELSVRCDRVVLLAKALRPLPKEWFGLKDVEQRYRRREVDLAVNPEARRIAVLRSRVVQGVRELLASRGFLEVETPMLQPRPGGALARPFVTHMNALDLDLYLRIAPELYLKRLIVGGLDRVFEINRNFRNEGMSVKHNPEFTMLEAYQAYADYHDMMELTQAIVQHAAPAGEISYQGRPVRLGGEWRRVTMLEAVRDAAGVPDLDYDWPVERMREVCDRTAVPYEPSFGAGRLVTELFEKHVEGTLWDPTFVLDYPKEVSPLARAHRSNPHVTERFELICTGRELANAFSELNDPVDQRRRFEDQARARAAGDEEAMVLDEDFLTALEHGMPPAGGLGVGIDRLVMLLADAASIREVILFPLLRPEGRPATR